MVESPTRAVSTTWKGIPQMMRFYHVEILISHMRSGHRELTVSSAEVAPNLQFSTVLTILVLLLLQVCHSFTLSWKIPI